MWEALTFIFGVATVIGTFLVREGQNRAIMKAMTRDITDLKISNSFLKENIALQQQSINMQRERIDAMQRDHIKMDESIDALNGNIAINNKAIASLDATLGGVQNLLKLIFDGKMKMV